jgi:hypothetical protein
VGEVWVAAPTERKGETEEVGAVYVVSSRTGKILSRVWGEVVGKK